MPKYIFDDKKKIKKIDSKNMLDSLLGLGKQMEQIWKEASALKIPNRFGLADNIVVLGMGGSALGAHIIKSLFFNYIKVPVEIVNCYHVPNYVGHRSLVIVSSYSGSTEETISAVKEAKSRNARIVSITTGGALEVWSHENNVPTLLFKTGNNPCGSPRAGLGYAIVGMLALFAKIGYIRIVDGDVYKLIEVAAKCENKFGVEVKTEDNPAKQLAIKIQESSVWFVASGHLSGSAHIAANQMNENAKRFAGYFLIPELNHHLLEGMINPKSNNKNLTFVFLESKLYDEKLRKRCAITKEILEQNKIAHEEYQCVEEEFGLQVIEALLFGSYASFYSAILAEVDPTPNIFVDYFKKQLK